MRVRAQRGRRNDKRTTRPELIGLAAPADVNLNDMAMGCGGIAAAEMFHPGTPAGYWDTHADELLGWHLTYLVCVSFLLARSNGLMGFTRMLSCDAEQIEALFYDVVMPVGIEMTLLSPADREMFEMERVMSALGAGSLDWEGFESHLRVFVREMTGLDLDLCPDTPPGSDRR